MVEDISGSFRKVESPTSRLGYQGLIVIQKNALILLTNLHETGQLSGIVNDYVGVDCALRYRDNLRQQLEDVGQILDNSSRKRVRWDLLAADKLELTALKSDRFQVPRVISSRLFASGEFNQAFGTDMSQFPEFQVSISTYLLQQFCGIKFVNPEVRLSVYATNRMAEDSEYRQANIDRLEAARIGKGFLSLSDEDVVVLTRDWMGGVSIKEIAEKMGRSIRSVGYHASELELPRRRTVFDWSEEEKAELVKLKAEGFLNSQIVRILERSESGVKKMLARVGVLSYQRKAWDDREVERLKELLAKKMTYREVLAELSKDFPRGRRYEDIKVKVARLRKAEKKLLL